jgi:hypothetical protein
MRKGIYKGQRLISEKTMGEIFTPRNVVPPMPGREAWEMPLGVYAYGWFLQPYRGHMHIHHSGNLTGFSTNVALLPADDYDVVSFVNAGGSSFHFSMTYSIFDDILGGDNPRDWTAFYAEGAARFRKEGEENNKKILDAVNPEAKPCHPPADYAGKYTNRGYGDVTVLETPDGLELRYAAGRFPLTHCNYDTYYFDSVPAYAFNNPRSLFTAQFRTDSRGSVRTLEIPLEPALKEPIAFTKEKSEEAKEAKC